MTVVMQPGQTYVVMRKPDGDEFVGPQRMQAAYESHGWTFVKEITLPEMVEWVRRRGARH